jgi:hypothetical protein
MISRVVQRPRSRDGIAGIGSERAHRPSRLAAVLRHRHQAFVGRFVDRFVPKAVISCGSAEVGVPARAHTAAVLHADAGYCCWREDPLDIEQPQAVECCARCSPPRKRTPVCFALPSGRAQLQRPTTADDVSPSRRQRRKITAPQAQIAKPFRNTGHLAAACCGGAIARLTHPPPGFASASRGGISAPPALAHGTQRCMGTSAVIQCTQDDPCQGLPGRWRHSPAGTTAADTRRGYGD